MTTEHPQDETDLAKPLTISRFLMGAMITTAAVTGAVGGLAMLFMADMFFDVGPDPALEQREFKKVNERVTELEHMLQESADQGQTTQTENDSALTQELTLLKESYEAALTETKALKDELVKTYEQSGADERIAKVTLGITQLKHANETDTSFEPGIETLQQVFTAGVIHDKLEELKQASQEDMPDRADILSDLDAYRYSNDKNDSEQQGNDDNTPKTWKDRAVDMVKTVVEISPTAAIVNDDILQSIGHAVTTGNFVLAESIAEKLPESPRSQLIRKKIALRANTQRTIDTIVSKASTVLSFGSKGSLY